jgi:hypothetical protein
MVTAIFLMGASLIVPSVDSDATAAFAFAITTLL